MTTELTLIPKEMGLPPKFHRWRADQAEAVEDIVTSGKRIYLLDAPTGSGKSVCAIAAYKRLSVPDEVIARMTDDDEEFRCIYLTRTIQLQQQILQDFPAKMVKGRRNYVCNARPKDYPKITAEDCPGNTTSHCSCSYKYEKSETAHAGLACLNDAYYLAETNGPGEFHGANMVVLDEIDSLDSCLMDFIKFTVSERTCKKYGLAPPENIESLSKWQGWTQQAYRRVDQARADMSRQLPMDFNTWTDVDIKLNKDVKQAESFLHQMAMFIDEVNDTWILDHESKTKAGWQVTFKPVTVGAYCEKYLWRHGKRFLGMSGTILDPQILADDLGIEDYGYKRLDSHFPVANRLIRHRPVANLKYADMDEELPKLLTEVARLIKVYPGQNVLIHTVSFKIRQYLMGMLPIAGIDPDILMTHETDTRSEQLAIFKQSRGKVMISPSFDRGLDLADDECRVNIIAKIPYLALGDKQVKARMALPRGQRWYNLRAIQTVMQMSGRAVRSNTDWAHTIILDKQFDMLLARTKHLLPKWWTEAIRRENVDEI